LAVTSNGCKECLLAWRVARRGVFGPATWI